jgi:hypothetical protein
VEDVARFEWVIMFGIVIGLALWELRSVRRAMREKPRPRDPSQPSG